MSKKGLIVLSLLAMTLASGSALAFSSVNDEWKNTTNDGLWKTAANWSFGFLPDCNETYQDKAVIKQVPGPTIDSTTNAKANWVVIGDSGDGELFVTGGTLTIGLAPGDTWMIIAYGNGDTGTLTMNGGTITTADRVYVGFHGAGTLIVNGGTMNIGGTFGIGSNDDSGTTANGNVVINGGTINAAGTFVMANVPGCKASLNLAGGTLVLSGDKTSTVNSYIAAGYIKAYGGLGNVVVSSVGGNTVLSGMMDPLKARGPSPAISAVGVAPYALLEWVPGDTAVNHKIYLGTDANAVATANESTAAIYKGTQDRDANSFDPAGLELNTTYYWRVDEVTDANTYKGNVWQFKTAAFAPIDDFESFSDTAGLAQAWSKGVTAATLSLATSNGHEKAKSLKFDYNNAIAPYYSEAQSNTDFDWTVSNVKGLEIYFKGQAANGAQPMYAAVEDNAGHVAVVVNSDPNLKSTDWQAWRINTASFTGIDLTNVTKFYIGIGNRTNPVTGSAGTVYFDDIRIYPSRCIANPQTDLNKDCVVDIHDFAIMAANWLKQQP